MGRQKLCNLQITAMQKKALIIGGGFGGCTASYCLKQKGWEITLVHPSSTLGGGVRTNLYAGHPVTFGPRHFLTHNEQVYDFLASRLNLRRCQEHEFLTFVGSDNQFYSYPIHEDDIPRMPEASNILEEISALETSFRTAKYSLTTGNDEQQAKATDYEDFWQKSVGNTLYDKFIRRYTQKMWQIDDNTMIDDFSWSPKGVALKRGPRAGWDTAISAYPTAFDGYNSYFDKAQELADTFYKGTVSHVKPNTLCALIDGEHYTYDLIINTAPLDDIYNRAFGELRYVGRRVEYVVLPVEYALPPSVYFAYYSGDEPYTRVVEYKKFTKYECSNTVISMEYPVLGAGKYYPMPIEADRQQHSRYASLAHQRFFNVGRIARYNYRYDIDDAIEQVLDIADRI
jgi:UDP-galactopyranose mutase